MGCDAFKNKILIRRKPPFLAPHPLEKSGWYKDFPASGIDNVRKNQLNWSLSQRLPCDLGLFRGKTQPRQADSYNPTLVSLILKARNDPRSIYVDSRNKIRNTVLLQGSAWS